MVGPTLDPLELAGRKLLALFDRAAPRDFVDVYVLTSRFNQGAVLDMAREIDPGFDLRYLCVALDRANQLCDVDFPIDAKAIAALRRWGADWAQAIRNDLPIANSSCAYENTSENIDPVLKGQDRSPTATHCVDGRAAEVLRPYVRLRCNLVTTISVTTEQHEQLKEMANSEGIAMWELVDRFLRRERRRRIGQMLTETNANRTSEERLFEAAVAAAGSRRVRDAIR